MTSMEPLDPVHEPFGGLRTPVKNLYFKPWILKFSYCMALCFHVNYVGYNNQRN